MKKLTALFMALTLTVASMATVGCREQEDVKPISGTKVTKSTVLIDGEVGTEQAVGDSVVTLDGAYRSVFSNMRGNYPCDVVFLKFTVTNNTDKSIDAGILRSCEVEINDKPYDPYTLFSLSSTYKQYGNDVETFADPIPAGKTVTGYIGLSIPQAFETMTIKYSPLTAVDDGSNEIKYLSYTFKQNDLQKAEEPKSPPVTDDSLESNSDDVAESADE